MRTFYEDSRRLSKRSLNILCLGSILTNNIRSSKKNKTMYCYFEMIFKEIIVLVLVIIRKLIINNDNIKLKSVMISINLIVKVKF